MAIKEGRLNSWRPRGSLGDLDADLEPYHRKPGNRRANALPARFVTLDRLPAPRNAGKAGLPMGLERPEIPPRRNLRCRKMAVVPFPRGSRAITDPTRSLLPRRQ